MDTDYVINHQNIIDAYYKAGYITDNEKDDLQYALLTNKNLFINALTKDNIRLQAKVDVDGREICYSYYDSRKYGILTYNVCITVFDDNGMIDFLVYYDIENNKFIEEQ